MDDKPILVGPCRSATLVPQVSKVSKIQAGTEPHLMPVVAHEEGRKGAMSTLTVGRIMRDFACLLRLEETPITYSL